MTDKMNTQTRPKSLFLHFINLIIFTTFLPVELIKAESNPTKNKNNIRKFEEETGDSFSAKVKIVRVVQDETEVFFESEKARGLYVLPASSKNFTIFKNRLYESLKPGGPSVRISTDADRKIQSVELEDSRSPASQKIDWDKI